MASVAPVAAKAARVSPSRHGRGAAGGARQHHGSARPPARSARGRAPPRRRRRPARRASSYRGCRARRAGASARRARSRSTDRPNAAAPRRGPPRGAATNSAIDLVERSAARCRRCARAGGQCSSNARAAPASRHRGRPGSAAIRSRPRSVIRSAAPGPAPMKCTVMALLASSVAGRAGGHAPLAMRGTSPTISRASSRARPAASAAASLTEATPATASEARRTAQRRAPRLSVASPLTSRGRARAAGRPTEAGLGRLEIRPLPRRRDARRGGTRTRSSAAATRGEHRRRVDAPAAADAGDDHGAL